MGFTEQKFKDLGVMESVDDSEKHKIYRVVISSCRYKVYIVCKVIKGKVKEMENANTFFFQLENHFLYRSVF